MVSTLWRGRTLTPPRARSSPGKRLHLVVAVAEEKWQRLCPWLVRQQMVLALWRGRLLCSSMHLLIPLRRNCVRLRLLLRWSGRVPFQWPVRQQMALVLQCGQPLCPPVRSLFPWRRYRVQSMPLPRMSGRGYVDGAESMTRAVVL